MAAYFKDVETHLESPVCVTAAIIEQESQATRHTLVMSH